MERRLLTIMANVVQDFLFIHYKEKALFVLLLVVVVVGSTWINAPGDRVPTQVSWVIAGPPRDDQHTPSVRPLATAAVSSFQDSPLQSVVAGHMTKSN